VKRDGVEIEVEPEAVQRGEIVVVRPGETVPVDGRVRAGTSTVDQSRITGEPMPAEKGPGDEIWSGSVNEYGALEIEAERVGRETTGGAHRPPDRRSAAAAGADRARRRSHGAVLPAGGAARERRDLLRDRRDDADGGGAHRRLSLRAGAGRRRRRWRPLSRDSAARACW
jgi:magnesium-transporting ATPase (P-type)